MNKIVVLVVLLSGVSLSSVSAPEEQTHSAQTMTKAEWEYPFSHPMKLIHAT